MIHEQSPHQACGQREEMGPVLPFDVYTHELLVGLVHESRGLQGVSLIHAPDHTARDVLEIVVD